MDSLRESERKKNLSISQRQAIIKLTEKPGKDKRLIQNWWPVSLLNIHQKYISKAPSARLRKTLVFLINPGQTTYLDGRFICERCRLISDILETKTLENIEGYLLEINIIECINLLLKNQKSCIINGGHNIHYFNLKCGTHQGNPFSAHFFILLWEILFIFTKSNKNIYGKKIFK